MKAAQYLIEVRRTLSPHNTPATTRLGLRGETGEVCDLVKKWTGHGVQEDPSKILKELGDVCWYAASRLIEIADFNEDQRADLITAATKFPVILNTDELIMCVEALQDLAIEFGNGGDAQHHPIAYMHDTGALLFTMVKALGHRYGFTLEQILQANVDKLRARYPDGFSTAASVAKADEKRERAQAEAALALPMPVGGVDANGSPV